MIPWQQIPEDYDFENDFEAPSKLFWCKGPHGEGHWTNDELWEDYKSEKKLIGKCPWYLKVKITHYAYIAGPKEDGLVVSALKRQGVDPESVESRKV